MVDPAEAMEQMQGELGFVPTDRAAEMHEEFDSVVSLSGYEIAKDLFSQHLATMPAEDFDGIRAGLVANYDKVTDGVGHWFEVSWLVTAELNRRKQQQVISFAPIWQAAYRLSDGSLDNDPETRQAVLGLIHDRLHETPLSPQAEQQLERLKAYFDGLDIN